MKPSDPVMPGKTRQQKKEETRNLILETAKRLFLELGYEKTTMRMISREAGVATGTAFTHYPDKKTLLMEALNSGITDTVSHAMETLPPNGTPKEILTHITGCMFAYFWKTPELSKSLISDYLFFKGAWQDKMDAELDLFAEFIKNLLEEEQRKGGLHPASDCDTLTHCFIAQYSYAISEGLRLDMDLNTRNRTFRKAVDTLFFGHLTGPK